jgi:hypothetical protein
VTGGSQSKAYLQKLRGMDYDNGFYLTCCRIILISAIFPGIMLKFFFLKFFDEEGHPVKWETIL